jgi:Tfp pilus assembly protein PilV
MTHPRTTRKSLQRSFTLVETLVAITILTLAILAPFDAVERVISSSRLSSDRLIASSLAQETLEYVRFFRTSNYLAGDAATTHYMNGMNGTSNRFGGTSCVFNLCTTDAYSAVGSIIQSCNSTDITQCSYLNVTNAGLYRQTAGGTATIYRRAFSYQQKSNYEVVTVVVLREDHGTHTIYLTENLYDWF